MPRKNCMGHISHHEALLENMAESTETIVNYADDTCNELEEHHIPTEGLRFISGIFEIAIPIPTDGAYNLEGIMQILRYRGEVKHIRSTKTHLMFQVTTRNFDPRPMEDTPYLLTKREYYRECLYSQLRNFLTKDRLPEVCISFIAYPKGDTKGILSADAFSVTSLLKNYADINGGIEGLIKKLIQDSVDASWEEDGDDISHNYTDIFKFADFYDFTFMLQYNNMKLTFTADQLR